MEFKNRVSSQDSCLAEERRTEPVCILNTDQTNLLVNDEEKEKGAGGGTALGVYLNILKNIMGTGMLAVPYALSLSGWGTGLGLMCGIMTAAMLNLVFIMKSCDYVKERGQDPTSYLTLADAAWGSRTGKYVEIIVVCYTSCTLIAYGVLIPQFLAEQPHLPWWLTTKATTMVVASIFLFPLCVMDSIEKLKITSLLGNAVILYTVGLVAVNYTGINTTQGQVVAATEGIAVLQAIPTLLFAYNFHYNMPVYYRELKNRSVKKMLCIVAAVYGTVTVLYCVIGLPGYFSFGDTVKSNVVLNLSGLSADVCKVLLGFMVLFTYPVIHFASRGALGRVIVSPTGALSFRQRGALTIGIITATMLLSIGVPNIGVVIALNGAIFGVCQHYFIPTLAFYTLSKGIAPEWQRKGSLGIFCLGVVVGTLGLIGTIRNLISGSSR